MSEAGTYKLQTINGSAPPQWVKTEEYVSTVVVDSELVLVPPHDFSGFFKYENTDTRTSVMTPATETWDVASGGRYAKAGGMYNFVFENPNDTAPESGTIAEGLLILYAGGNRFQYEKSV